MFGRTLNLSLLGVPFLFIIGFSNLEQGIVYAAFTAQFGSVAVPFLLTERQHDGNRKAKDTRNT